MATRKSVQATAERFCDWMRDAALPVWAETGWDHSRGGFFERLNLDATADRDAIRRVRSQARQIYVFAHAHELGWFDGKALALKGLDYLVDKAWNAGGAPGWAMKLDADGRVSDARRDLYEHAFALLALSHVYRITGDAQVKALAMDTLAFIDEVMGHTSGGWRESDPDRQPRRQNPHMHMFEASLALHEAFGGQAHLARAGSILRLMRDHWLLPSGGLREVFKDDWSPLPGSEGRKTEPGHQFEWVWLLDRYAELSGHEPGPESAGLYAFATAYGRSQASGLIVAAVRDDGVILDGSGRTWQQTEHLKAALVQGMRERSGGWSNAQDALHQLFSKFLKPAPTGCWIDAYDEAGNRAVNHITASTLYHLLVAAVEADRVFNRKAGSIREVAG
ncbi:AGE family epimerase/isomerase [Hyphobacterium sp.]|uniref:AGE family epimerase/isomerase n=1 Tax=Hyphobacterium sp. TaxID=2004662 RepID=UPI003B51C156